MKIYAWKGDISNFGDDLNEWLWKQLFDNIDDADTSCCLVGIGSILTRELVAELNSYKRKIVFGTGVRPSIKHPVLLSKLKLDKNWDVEFLRGPLSANYLDNKYEYITDAAYAIRQLKHFENYVQAPKKYEISFMPYFGSLKYFDWEKFCNDSGFHYISPLSEQGVEYTIKEIAASKKIITEAMHGAIVADALRIPWQRFIFSTYYNEYSYISEFKWSDWLLSLQMTHVEPVKNHFYTGNNMINFIKDKTQRVGSKTIFNQRIFLEPLLQRLEKNKNYYCSDNLLIHDIDSKIAKKIDDVKKSF
ncbi:MAG: polysaccharide pyruvyl transferase family protein [Prevotellaceae bacterium]|jgi:succinoglycan biosynthesis protein ExoV|nr:polysaccharide pyruvyl transferase family protein [Prevotellaceae bacterium]